MSEFSLKPKIKDKLYRVVISNSINGSFAIDGGTGKPKISKEQFQLPLGSGYSCGLKSSYVDHKNDPFSVYSNYPAKSPLLSKGRGDTIISFDYAIVGLSGLTLARLTSKEKIATIDSLKTKSLNDTFKHGHVCIESIKNINLSSKEQIFFLAQLNNRGWSIVANGGF